MDILSRNQLKQINDIIERHMNAMMHLTIGKLHGNQKIDQNTLARLGLPAYTKSVIDNAYVLGKLVQILDDNSIKNMTFEELKNRAEIVHLTDVEQNSLDYAKKNAAQYVTGLGQKVSTAIHSLINDMNQDANLEKIERGVIRDRIAQAVINRDSQQKVISALGHLTGDWTRDWMRLVHTELWNAKLTGQAVSILRGESIYGSESQGDTLVFRRPAPDACPDCKRLYLESDGVTPKIFKLTELIHNGNNVGKKRKDWKPIVTSTHPNCACPLSVIPAGFGFDKKGQLTYLGTKEGEINGNT